MLFDAFRIIANHKEEEKVQFKVNTIDWNLLKMKLCLTVQRSFQLRKLPIKTTSNKSKLRGRGGG
jgi:hypothetical protein